MLKKLVSPIVSEIQNYKKNRQRLELKKRREEEANLESELEMDGDLSQGSPTGESKNDDSDQENEQEFEVKNGQEVENGDGDENDSQPQTGGGQAFEQLEVETADNLEEALRDLTNINRSRENEYIELPEVKLENIIISNSEIHDRIKSYWNNEMTNCINFLVHYSYMHVLLRT